MYLNFIYLFSHVFSQVTQNVLLFLPNTHKLRKSCYASVADSTLHTRSYLDNHELRLVKCYPFSPAQETSDSLTCFLWTECFECWVFNKLLCLNNFWTPNSTLWPASFETESVNVSNIELLVNTHVILVVCVTCQVNILTTADFLFEVFNSVVSFKTLNVKLSNHSKETSNTLNFFNWNSMFLMLNSQLNWFKVFQMFYLKII